MQKKVLWIWFAYIFTGQLPHKHKIVIAGNHELSFDHTFTHPFQKLSNPNDRDRRLHTGNCYIIIFFHKEIDTIFCFCLRLVNTGRNTNAGQFKRATHGCRSNRKCSTVFNQLHILTRRTNRIIWIENLWYSLATGIL